MTYKYNVIVVLNSITISPTLPGKYVIILYFISFFKYKNYTIKEKSLIIGQRLKVSRIMPLTITKHLSVRWKSVPRTTFVKSI